MKTNFRFLKVPVELTDGGGNTITIGQEQLAYDTDKRAGAVFVAPLKFLESEGYVWLGAKKNGTIYALERADGGVSVFQDGIFVTQLTSLLPEGARQYVVTRINFVGQDKSELSMGAFTFYSLKELVGRFYVVFSVVIFERTLSPNDRVTLLIKPLHLRFADSAVNFSIFP